MKKAYLVLVVFWVLGCQNSDPVKIRSRELGVMWNKDSYSDHSGKYYGKLIPPSHYQDGWGYVIYFPSTDGSGVEQVNSNWGDWSRWQAMDQALIEIRELKQETEEK